MAEESVQTETAVVGEEASATVRSASESQENRSPNSFRFATILLGGWAALMILFTLIAVVAMTLVGIVAG